MSKLLSFLDTVKLYDSLAKFFLNLMAFGHLYNPIAYSFTTPDSASIPDRARQKTRTNPMNGRKHRGTTQLFCPWCLR